MFYHVFGARNTYPLREEKTKYTIIAQINVKCISTWAVEEWGRPGKPSSGEHKLSVRMKMN